MTNIYVKVTIEKNWHYQNFYFVSLKDLSPGQFCGTPIHVNIIKFQNSLLRLKNQRSGNKAVCGFSIILILKGIMKF